MLVVQCTERVMPSGHDGDVELTLRVGFEGREAERFSAHLGIDRRGVDLHADATEIGQVVGDITAVEWESELRDVAEFQLFGQLSESELGRDSEIPEQVQRFERRFQSEWQRHDKLISAASELWKRDCLYRGVREKSMYSGLDGFAVQRDFSAFDELKREIGRRFDVGFDNEAHRDSVFWREVGTLVGLETVIRVAEDFTRLHAFREQVAGLREFARIKRYFSRIKQKNVRFTERVSHLVRHFALFIITLFRGGRLDFRPSGREAEQERIVGFEPLCYNCSAIAISRRKRNYLAGQRVELVNRPFADHRKVHVSRRGRSRLGFVERRGEEPVTLAVDTVLADVIAALDAVRADRNIVVKLR